MSIIGICPHDPAYTCLCLFVFFVKIYLAVHLEVVINILLASSCLLNTWNRNRNFDCCFWRIRWHVFSGQCGSAIRLNAHHDWEWKAGPRLFEGPNIRAKREQPSASATCFLSLKGGIIKISVDKPCISWWWYTYTYIYNIYYIFDLRYYVHSHSVHIVWFEIPKHTDWVVTLKCQETTWPNSCRSMGLQSWIWLARDPYGWMAIVEHFFFCERKFEM